MQNETLNIEEGSFIQHNITNEYVKRDLQNINITNKLKIAWDTGNGAMGLIIKEITSQLQNTKNILINENVDGTFPNHHPDPTVPKNMEQLIRTVIDYKCDIAFAFDGDGNRLGVVDNRGKIVWADQYMLILSHQNMQIRSHYLQGYPFNSTPPGFHVFPHGVSCSPCFNLLF